MRGHSSDDDQLGDFVAARTAELHRTAYLLTADQDRAERLVECVVAELRRRGMALGQAEATARHQMARMAGAVAIPTTTDDDTADPAPTIARLSPRERAVLMLRCVDGYDLRATARELGLSRARTEAADRSASQSLGSAVGDDELRTQLTDFAEQATWPDPEATLAGSTRIRPPRRRSRKRYVAVAAVLALTAAAPIGSQVQHDKWLRTPAGINATHGTHFHAYTQGYKLVGVQRVPTGGLREPATKPHEVVAFSCRHFSVKSANSLAQVGDGDGQGMGPYPCAKQSAERYFLSTFDEPFTVRPPKSGTDELLLARYVSVPWDQYPVATSGFEVEHDLTLASVLQFRKEGGAHVVASGRTITLTGTNGVTTAVLPLPPAAAKSGLYLSGLFSPTTTGKYKITVGGQPVPTCGSLDDESPWCVLYDHYIPQLMAVSQPTDKNGNDVDNPTRSARVVRVEVHDALGPWKLEVRYDRFTQDAANVG